MKWFRWLWGVLLADLAADDQRIRRLAMAHARRLKVRLEKGRRAWTRVIAQRVPPPVAAEGDTLASAEAKRLALVQLHRALHRKEE